MVEHSENMDRFNEKIQNIGPKSHYINQGGKSNKKPSGDALPVSGRGRRNSLPLKTDSIKKMR
jgi:hypothetical protein